MDSHQEHLRRGFSWLASATVIAKIVDLATLLVVLLFLSKPQVGAAALVISIGTVVEAFDGLGTREALVQARAVSRMQLDTLFWLITGAASFVGVLVLLAAPLLAGFYGVAGMATYLLAVAAKQPIVAAAVIPLALMNRDLQYERIAVVNVCATFGAALTRLGLAVSGAGIWALVAGNCASGLYILVGAQLARPFRPRFRFRMAEIAPLMHFGMRAVTSGFLEQSLKNVDYLLIGWLYGPAQLAVYGVALTVAMEPATAVGTLINRTALPVFVRASPVKEQLGESLLWSLRALALLVVPMMAASMLAARPLTALLHDGQGNSYAAAALPLELLAVAALLRVTSQLLYPFAIAIGLPALAARFSAVTLLLLITGILLAGLHFPAPAGLVAVSAVWVAIYPFLLLWEVHYLRRHWNIRARALARTFILPSIGAVALTGIVAAARLLARGSDVRVQLGIVLAAVALTYAGLFLHSRERSYGAT